MNQPNLPVMAPRTAAPTEAADLLVALRRYAWLLISGAVLGTAVGGSFYYYMRKYEPRYTASYAFQVLAPPAPIGTPFDIQPQNNVDEVSQLIHRQEFLFEQEPFLQEIMNCAEFHTNPDNPTNAGNDESKWLHDNKQNLMKAIKRDLRIVPRLNAAAFELTMKTKDPYESYALVKAAAEVYLNHLKDENSALKSHRLDSLKQARDKADVEFKNESDGLAAWAKANDVDVQRSRYEIEKNTLQQLNEESIRVSAMAVLADAQFKNVSSLLDPIRDKDTGKPDPKLIDKVQLTPDVEQYAENDSTLRTLDAEKLQWEQELAVELKSKTPNPIRIDTIHNRMDAIAMLRAREKDRIRAEAADRMEQGAKTDKESKAALAADVENKRAAKNSIVLNIGQKLMEYQQRFDSLRAREELRYKVTTQFGITDANRGTDDVRVQRLAADAMRPYEPSDPQWIKYIPVGTLAGLGLSALLAYLLLLTDTRVRTPRDISRSLQLTLLGFVPDESDDRTLTGDVETAILSSPASMVAEAFRQIRSNVMAQTAHNPANTLLVASIAPGGGSTTVAANLAAAMALNDIRVLLVDANFYRPGLGRVFTNIPETGLADALADNATLDSSIVPHPSLPKLHLMGPGSELNGASSEMFEGKAFRDLVEKLKSRYDMIIFDGAPLNLVSDSLALASRVDGVVSVVRAGEVSRGTVTRVRDQLRNVHANLLGFVLNAVQTNNSGYFKENYRTFYRYAGTARRTGGTKLLGN